MEFADMTSIALPPPDAAIVKRRPAIVAELQKLLGADRVIGDEDGRRAYDTDALTSYRRMPLAVLLPRSTEEVAASLKYCHANGIKVVARGAGTSLAGGALPAEDARPRLSQSHRAR
jgi:glycolate oxidase